MQTASSGMFLSFDSLLSKSSSTQATAYERHSSLYPISQASTTQSSRPGHDGSRSASVGKRRWGLLKNIMPFTGIPADRLAHPLATNPLVGKEPSWIAVSQRAEVRPEPKLDRSNKKALVLDSEVSQNAISYHSHSFKFSLEWIDREINVSEKDRQFEPPRLPLAAQMILHSSLNESPRYKPCKPVGNAVGPSKYVGRALAEWSNVINECQAFFEKRRNEGVPTSFKIETPTLGIESFRKYK